jgi:hypothetical protein
MKKFPIRPPTQTKVNAVAVRAVPVNAVPVHPQCSGSTAGLVIALREPHDITVEEMNATK